MEAANEKNTTTVSGIRNVVNRMQVIENVRAGDRALIDRLANGGRPYTDAEVKEHQIRYNVNWGELNRQLRDANRQINAALLFKPTLFTATSYGGKVEKRDEWGQKFTNNLNRVLTSGKVGKRHTYVLRSRNASLCLHGIGVLFWANDYAPLPKFTPLENLLIPTYTSLDLSDLMYFDIRVEVTPFEFYDLTYSEKVRDGWNKDQIQKILDSVQDIKEINPNNYNWLEQPEKMQEIFKENRAFLDSDACAKIKLDYFFEKKRDIGDWTRKIILRDPPNTTTANPDEFVFESEEPFAHDIDEILHVQYGDNSIVAPLKYHSVRGLGQMLYSVSEALNRFRNRLFGHVDEQLNMYFRVDDPSDRGKQNKLELANYGIIETGVTIVPNTERHQVDSGLVESAMSQCRQLMSESGSSFVQDINDGTDKEMTATEANARLQSVNVAVSSMLQMIYHTETFYYEELVRRFLGKNTQDKAVEEFQELCKKDGIPDELMEPKNWKVIIERVFGSGDRSLAIQEATTLFAQRTAFDPKSQRIIERDFVATLTNNPSKAMLLVPDDPQTVTSGTIEAERVFATLMDGIPISLREGIDQFGYIESMIGMMTAVIQRIIATDGVGTPQEVVGLQTVAADVAKHIEIIGADPLNKQKVKIYSDELGKLMNEVKAFAQRQQEAAAKQSEAQSPEAQAKAQSILQQSELKMKVKEAEFEQKLAHREQQFEQKLAQQAQNHELAMKKMFDTAQAELIQKGLLTGQQLEHEKQRQAVAAAAPEKKS